LENRVITFERDAEGWTASADVVVGVDHRRMQAAGVLAGRLAAANRRWRAD